MDHGNTLWCVLHRLLSPCDGCAAPYGFRNRLNLTEDTARFRVKLPAILCTGRSWCKQCHL